MAEGVAFSFLGKIAERMVDPIVRQFSYLFFYNSNIENLEQELKRIQAARDGVKLQVVAAEQNLETIDPAMQLWLEGVDEIESKASTVIEGKSKVERMCLNLGCCNVKQRYFLSRKATKLIDGISKHKGDGVKYAKSTHLASPPGIVTDNALTPELPTRIAISQSTTSSEGFESRKTIVEKVMVSLKDDGIRMIGICGIGGIGKTTMANEVCRRAKAQGLFEQFAMTSVSQTQDLLKIQKELAGMLGLTLDDGDTILLRAQRLHERLSKGRKILVILDDVWEELPLQNVGIPTERTGCKVICTSRNKDVLSDMGTHINFDVGVLTATESWDLFEANAGNVGVTTDLYATAEKIVKKCGGLPIAIVTLARALKNKKKHVWDTALRRLEKSTGEKIRGMAEHVYKCIELSYTFLKDSQTKALLLLCCLFPEDADIPIVALVRFKDLPALEVTEDEVRTLVGDLIGSNLLLGDEENERVVKMHDIVREVCLSIEGLNKFQQPSIGMANRRFISRRSAFFEEKRSQAFKQVMDALADDQISTIGIPGLCYGWMSILIDEVIEKVKEGNLFDDVAMIGMGDLFEMQGYLARKLGLADSVRGVTSISERAKQLQARLTDGRRRLIILRLYGTWKKEIDLENVGIPVGAEHNKKGCKVAFVSEFDQDVCLRMGSEKIIRFERFSKKEELVLLREHARFDEEVDPIAKQIVEELEGEPREIVRLGEALKNQNKNVWLDALHRLKGRVELPIKREDVPPWVFVVEFSYNSLSSSQAKMLLLLLCIISRGGNDIPMEKLVVMWVKLFKGELEAARNKVMDSLQELHTRFLIQIGFHENAVSVYPIISHVVLTTLDLFLMLMPFRLLRYLKVTPGYW